MVAMMNEEADQKNPGNRIGALLVQKQGNTMAEG